MATSKPHPGSGKPGQQKLGQTLLELESALADWDTLQTEVDAPSTVPPEERAKDAELRKKTKKLLDQLREQLAELED